MCPTSGRSIYQGLWKQIAGCNEPWRLQEAFGVLDTDGDGQIKSSDLTHFFESFVGTSISEEEVQVMIGMADLDGNGAVDLQEFEHLMTDDISGKESLMIGEGEMELLREMFRNLDVNQDGVLCAEDLGAAMDLFGQPICEEEELQAMVSAAMADSTSKSPTIDFHSFCRFMTPSSRP